MNPLASRNLLAASVAMVLTGCMTTPPQEDPVLLKLAELERRLVSMERVVQNDSLVNLVASVDAMQQDLNTLRGQVEELSFASDSAAKRQRELYLDLDNRIQSLEKGGVAATSSSVGGLPMPGGSDEGNYRAAFDLLKEGQYEAAASAFSQFLTAYPDSNLSDNAQYWLAESYYVSQKFKEALPEFETVVRDYSGSAKTPDALLKIGYCNYELANWDAARAALSRVEKEYSDTTAARLASQRLARMRSESR